MPARSYRTLAELAAADVQSTQNAGAVEAGTCGRRRSLSESELRELGRQVRAHRLLALRRERRRARALIA
jgi:hypothetical protein